MSLDDGTTPGRRAHRQSLRRLLADLAAAGELVSVPGAVDRRHELAAHLVVERRGPALRFDDVIGCELPVVANVLNSRERIARGLATPLGELQQRLLACLDEPLQPRVVGDGPCQEVVVEEPSFHDLPVPTFFEHETGPYITAGAIVARDTVTGRRNLSIARIKPLDARRALIGVAPFHHLAVLARAAAARGERLELAVAIGNHAAVLIASALYLGLGDDELEHAGALLGEPLELVRCQTVDLEVPAHCELVLECTLDPAERVREGPVSEFHGMYEDYGDGYVVTLRRITRRADALFQVIGPGHLPEHILIGAVPIAAVLARALQRAVAQVVDVAVPEAGSGRLSAVVSLAEAPPGLARKVMFAVWSTVSLVKQVTVVDDDIDVWDAEQVEWARLSRMRPDRDLLIVPDVRSDRSEPLERDLTVTKLGIDATARPGDRDWTLARPPREVLERVRSRRERTP